MKKAGTLHRKVRISKSFFLVPVLLLFLFLNLTQPVFAANVLGRPRRMFLVKTEHFDIIYSNLSEETALLFVQNADALYEKAAEDLTEQRLERVKRKILADLVYANDDPQNAAYMVGYMISSGFSLQDIQTYDKHINDVRLADVQKALQKLLSASVVEGVLLPLTEDKNG